MLRLFLFLSILWSTMCLAETAQEVVIPGYVEPSLPVSNTITPNIKSPPLGAKIVAPKLATEDDLKQMIKAVDLNGWSTFASNLWTCTPSMFNLPTYNAKNRMQIEFEYYKTQKKPLTLKKATDIANILGGAVPHQIVGLVGNMCRIKISVPDLERPYGLNCLFVVMAARYLSGLAALVWENNGKEELLPSDAYNAIQQLIETTCTKDVG